MKKKDQVTAAEEQKEAVQVKGKKTPCKRGTEGDPLGPSGQYGAFVSGDSRGEHEQCIPHQRDAHGAGGP